MNNDKARQLLEVLRSCTWNDSDTLLDDVSEVVTYLLRENIRLTAELGDLPEAQAEMLSEIKRLRIKLAALEGQEPAVYRYKFKEDLQWQYTVNKSQAHRLSVIEPLYLAAGAKGEVDVIIQAISNPDNQPSQFGTILFSTYKTVLDALSQLVKAEDRADNLAPFADTFARESVEFQMRDAMKTAKEALAKAQGEVK